MEGAAEEHRRNDDVIPKSSSFASLPGNVEDDDEDEDVCRICRNPADSENPLRYPCACRGTIKYVHQDCLLQWLKHRNISHCEVCKHRYSFAPLYAENAPGKLPPREFMIGIALKAFSLLRLFLRLAYAICVWLLIIPFITYWVCELAFVRSFAEAQRLFLSHITVPVILADCAHGFLRSVIYCYAFLIVTFVRCYFTWEQRRPAGLVDRILGVNGNGGHDGGRQGIARVYQIIKRYALFLAVWWEVLAVRLMAFVGIIENARLNDLVGMQAPFLHFDDNAFAVLASNLVFSVAVVFLPFSLGRIVSFHILWLLSSAKAPVLSSVMPFTESGLSLANIALQNATSSVTYLSSESYGDGMLGQVSEVIVDILNTENNGTGKLPNSLIKPLPAMPFNGETIGSPHLSDDTTLLIGYMVILMFVLFYLGSVYLMHYAQNEPLTIWRLFGIVYFITVAILVLLFGVVAAFGQFATLVYRNFTTIVKVSFLLGIKFGLFPLLCGWWLDVCTVRMFGETIAQRVELFAENPSWISLVHWIVGIFYLQCVFIIVSLLQEVLRKGVLHFLRDIANPNYNLFREMIQCPMLKHFCYILFGAGVHGSLIVMLIFLPIKLVMLFTPSVFPLDLSYSNSKTFAASFAERCLFHYGIPCTVNFFYPSTRSKALICKWLTIVGSVLRLSDFLLPGPEDNGFQENGNLEPARPQRVNKLVLSVLAIAEGSIVSIYAPVNIDATGENRDEQADSEFPLRILLLLVLSWMTGLIINSFMMAVPILLGRAILYAFSHLHITLEIEYNDLYSFTTGSCIMRAVVFSASHAIAHIQTRRVEVLFKQFWQWCINVFKSCALWSIWIFVIPVLIGLLVDLMVIVPIRVPLDESPIFTLFQNWVLGLVLLIIWIGLVMIDNMELFVEGSWRAKLQRMLVDDGLPEPPAFWVWQEILTPILIKLLTALCVPYVFARGVFPMLGYPLKVNSAVLRFVWPCCLALSIMGFCAKKIRIWVIHLHNSIKDDRYRIGERLCDYKEESEEIK